MRFRNYVIFFVLIAALLIALPVFAQDATATPAPENETSPLLEMLALIPNTPAVQKGLPVISYIDYQALDMAWLGTPIYQSWAEWNTAHKAKAPGADQWWLNRQRINSGPAFWQYFMVGEETPELVGFDWLDMDRAVTFGTPPAQGLILGGDFDPEAITTAFSARDYTTADIDGVSVLQNGDGQKISVTNTNRANIFGGDLGRSEPLAIVPGYLLNSPSIETVLSTVGAYKGYQASLGTDPNYAAAARAVTVSGGLLIQAQFFNPLDVGMMLGDPASAILGADPTQIAEVLKEFPSDGANYGPLAPYTLAVMADRQEGDEQVLVIALVYGDAASAEAAAAELTTRLATFSSTLVTKSDTPLIEDIEGAAMREPRVYADEATGKYVALAEIYYSMPEPIVTDAEGQSTQGGETGTITAPGILFRRLVNAIYQRAFTPLVING